MSTHYIPAFTEINGRQQRAACGTWIRVHEHSAEPTCDGCKAYVEADAATAHLTAEDVFGPAPTTYPPTRPAFDPTGGHERRPR